MQFGEEDLDGKLRFDLKVLEAPRNLERFKEAILWVVITARQAKI